MTDDELNMYLNNYRHIWKTNAEFYTWLRGSLRKALWQFNPIKLDFKKHTPSLPPPEGYTGRAKMFVQCALSGDLVPKSTTEVDHVEGNVSLRCIDDILPFVFHLALPQQLQVVSKEAHKIKSYAEKQGISFEEAVVVKKAIEIEKGDWKKWLSDRGVDVKTIKAKDKRKFIIDVLTSNSK